MEEQISHLVDDLLLIAALTGNRRFGRFLADLAEDLVQSLVKQRLDVRLLAIGHCLALKDDLVDRIQDILIRGRVLTHDVSPSLNTGWYAMLLEILFALSDGVFLEVEDRRGQGGAGAPFDQTFTDMLQIADTARSDDRNLDGIADGAGQFDIETGLGAVAVHRGQEDLATAVVFHLLRPFDGVDAGRLAAAVGVDLPGLRIGAFNAAGIDGNNDTLAAKALGCLTDKLGVMHRSSIDRNLVGPGIEQVADIGDLAYPTTYGQRHEDTLGGLAHDIEDDAAVVAAGGDIKKGQLISTLRTVGLGRFNRITGVAQLDKVDPFDDAAILDVETGIIRLVSISGLPWSAPPLHADRWHRSRSTCRR